MKMSNCTPGTKVRFKKTALCVRDLPGLAKGRVFIVVGRYPFSWSTEKVELKDSEFGGGYVAHHDGLRRA